MVSRGSAFLTSLTEILIVHGLLPIEDLDTVRRSDRADEAAVRSMVDAGTISEVQFAQARAEQKNLPFVELLDYPVDRLAVAKVPAAVCRRANVLPIAFEGGLRVRYRIDGVLHDMQNAPSTIAGGVTSRIKIMSDLDIAERRKPQDGRMSVHHNGRTVDLRVAILPTVWGEKVVLRILDNATSSMKMSGLNLLTDNFNEFEMAYTKPCGRILVTGPTGSGKSTTLYTTLHAISRPEINVITVEDPVEYRMPGVNQVQVNRKAGLTFAVALRSILRAQRSGPRSVRPSTPPPPAP
ncbi:GspE/PulE family protein [Cryobacterium sp. TMS1-13-1]|uniref:GspE/PulE family protein n=1 Tax=Cryobacterium sp. TMS1-13-1 TaxID=1259220 RepID=UPI0021071222|nr:ATPase, T2SS/T4P/T4SS family [Cryobacterium sp. TMS1-13-1]